VTATARAALVAVAVVVADQAVKALVRSSIDRGDAVDLFLRIGIGGPVGSGKTALVAALCGLIVFFVLHGERRGIWLATGLLLGGALGNIIDRVRDGAVTDFVKLPHWPAFNVADIAITVGVVVVALSALTESREPATDP